MMTFQNQRNFEVRKSYEIFSPKMSKKKESFSPNTLTNFLIKENVYWTESFYQEIFCYITKYCVDFQRKVLTRFFYKKVVYKKVVLFWPKPSKTVRKF